MLVVSTRGGDQRVMDALSGEEIAARESNVSGDAYREALSLFSRDSRSVFSLDSDGLNRWSWQADDFLADACSRLTRNLTPEEWKQYIGG
jgi:hypothetical protein